MSAMHEPERADLTTASCSIAKTKRGRFFWAAWTTGAPKRRPFRQPDASNGGAASHAEALAEAERTTQRALTVIDSLWARGWMRVLRGEPPFGPLEEARLDGRAPASRSEQPRSIWTILDVPSDAGVDAIKRAYRARALQTHPDQGGDPEAFRAVVRAYQAAVQRRHKPRKR